MGSTSNLNDVFEQRWGSSYVRLRRRGRLRGYTPGLCGGGATAAATRREMAPLVRDMNILRGRRVLASVILAHFGSATPPASSRICYLLKEITRFF